MYLFNYNFYIIFKESRKLKIHRHHLHGAGSSTFIQSWFVSGPCQPVCWGCPCLESRINDGTLTHKHSQCLRALALYL